MLGEQDIGSESFVEVRGQVVPGSRRFGLRNGTGNSEG